MKFRWLILVVIGLIFAGCKQVEVVEPTMKIVVGETADFSEFLTPYWPYQSEHFPRVWIVNENGKHTVFNKHDQHEAWIEKNYDHLNDPSDCDIQWILIEQLFMSPCIGGMFEIDGTYVAGYALRELDRYPVEVIDGRLYVDFGNVQWGKEILEEDIVPTYTGR